jgi:hypothetical protein
MRSTTCIAVSIAARLVTKAAAAHVKEALVVPEHHVRECMEVTTVDEHILVALREPLFQVGEEKHQLAVATGALHWKAADLRWQALLVWAAHAVGRRGVAAASLWLLYRNLKPSMYDCVEHLRMVRRMVK